MKRARSLALAISGFIALTATGGGVAILTGVDTFPMEWLSGTPFTSYVIPALILAIAVGESSLLAAIALLRRAQRAPLVTLIAGILVAGYVSVEAIILNQEPPGPTAAEVVYFVLGLLLFVLGLILRTRSSRASPPRGPHAT